MALEALLGSILGELATLTGQYLGGSLGAALGLKDELEKLKRLLGRIKGVLADAEEKQIGNETVRMWFDSLKKVAYEAEDVVDQFNYEILRRKAAEAAAEAGMSEVPGRQVRNFFSSHNKILFRLKMGRKLKNIIKRIEEIESEGRMFNFAVSNVQPETTVPMRETSSFVVESDVVGRNEDREKTVTMLIENSQNLAVLPIVGMGGVGKTTMAQLIYNDPRVMNHFQLRVWVCVSDVWDMRKIIQDLIVSITGQNSELPTLELKQRVVREALMGKRYLIVLDDIWKEDRAEWDSLRSILDWRGSRGSAIIVTTRSKRVAEITGTLQSYVLSVLSEDESWTLFSSKSFASETEKPEELVEIGKAIVKKCGGLPLAIKMLGSSLYMKSDRNDWLKIRDSSLWNMKENDNILPALRLSYKHLPPYTKRCFAFCATFPKDYWIEKEMLIQMWMAHGFIPSGDRLDVKGHDIFNQLVQRSFLHDVKQEKCEYDLHDPLNKRNCRMHDLVHDLAQSIVRNECQALDEGNPEESTPKDVYHLSVSRFDDLDNKEAFTNLRTMIELYATSKVTGNFPQYAFLRVLLLRSPSFSRFSIRTKFLQHLRYLQLCFAEIRKLPDSICTLHHLQTLNLSGCKKLRKLPESICKLLNLETLNLCWCIDLCELPKRMQCMSGLKNIYLDSCYELNKMPAFMGRMTNLQTLTMYVVCDEDARGIEQLKGLNLSSKLEIYDLRHVKDAEEARQVKLHSKDLQWLTLCWRKGDNISLSNYIDADTNYSNQGNDENVLEELKSPDGINILEILGYKGLNFPTWIMGCLHLVQIRLGYCIRIHRLPPLWRLNFLEVLSLRRLDNLKYIIPDDGNAAGDTTVKPFPSLKFLSLRSLRSLEEWWENKNAAQAMAICFPSLVDLEIEECPELAGSMPLLSCVKYLRLVGSNKIRLGYFVPNETSYFGHLQCLEDLSITKCEEVLMMWLDMTGFGSRLKTVQVKECDWIFSSRRSGLWRCMASLENLSILECHALVDLFNVLQGLKSLRYLSVQFSLNVPEAAASTIDTCLPPQLEDFQLSSCQSLTTLMLRCPASLKSFTVRSCSNLVSLTAVEQELGQITSLEKIRILGCCRLKSLALEMGSLTVRRLSTYECTELTSLPECLLLCLPSLDELSITYCPELEKKCTRGGEYWHLVSNIPITREALILPKKSSTTKFTAKFFNFVCHH